MSNRNPSATIVKNQVSLVLAAIAGTAIFMAGLGLVADDAEARRKRARSQTQSIVKKPERPLVLVVSLRRQEVTVFDGEDIVRRAPISSGSQGRRTPMGIFSVIQKRRHHFSNLYNSAPMPFMQRITWSGIALHEGRLPGYPASHGCIRLPGGFARGLFKMTSMGTRIIVTRDTLRPRIFQSDALFKPLPFNVPAPTLARAPGSQAVGSQVPAPQALGAGSLATQTSASGGTMSMSAVVGVSDVKAAAGAAIGSEPAAANSAVATRDPMTTASLRPSDTVLKPFVAPNLRLTRAQLNAARAAGMLQLKNSVAETKDLLLKGRKAVNEKRLALREAGKTAAIAKQHLRRVKTYASKARRLTRRAASQLIAFERRYSNRTFDAVADADLLAKAMVREDVLEAQYFDQSEEADVAQIDAGDMANGLSQARQQVELAKNDLAAAHKDAKARLFAYNIAKGDAKKAKRAEKLRKKPIAIFISGRTGKLYIRQGYRPIYQTPVTIADKDVPLGTHVFTALQFDRSKTDLKWSVVSVDGDAGKGFRRRGRKAKRVSYPNPRPDRVLERITIPEDARYVIAQLIKPGSSLIVSDRRQSNETGKYTDFIVSLN